MADSKESKSQSLAWHEIMKLLDEQAISGDETVVLINRKDGREYKWPWQVNDAGDWKILRKLSGYETVVPKDGGLFKPGQADQ